MASYLFDAEDGLNQRCRGVREINSRRIYVYVQDMGNGIVYFMNADLQGPSPSYIKTILEIRSSFNKNFDVYVKK